MKAEETAKGAWLPTVDKRGRMYYKTDSTCNYRDWSKWATNWNGGISTDWLEQLNNIITNDTAESQAWNEYGQKAEPVSVRYWCDWGDPDEGQSRGSAEQIEDNS